jgi:hypothetical protein
MITMKNKKTYIAIKYSLKLNNNETIKNKQTFKLS